MCVTESAVPVVAWRFDPGHIAVPVDITVYSIDAAMRAAYRLTDRCFALVARNPERKQEAVVYLIGRSRSADLSALALEFHNELLDQQLRCRLEEQFKDVRTLIVAQAFSEGNLIDGDADDGDYRSDPLGAGAHR